MRRDDEIDELFASRQRNTVRTEAKDGKPAVHKTAVASRPAVRYPRAFTLFRMFICVRK